MKNDLKITELLEEVKVLVEEVRKMKDKELDYFQRLNDCVSTYDIGDPRLLNALQQFKREWEEMAQENAILRNREIKALFEISEICNTLVSVKSLILR